MLDSGRLVELLEPSAATSSTSAWACSAHDEQAQVFGQLRTTLSTPGTREQARRHIPLAGSADDAVCAQNIQTAELNALNAVLAVLRWKQARGVYSDLEHDVSSTYSIDGNTIAHTAPMAGPAADTPTLASSQSDEPPAGDTTDRDAPKDDSRSVA